jgi:hypothetical protein
MLGHPKAAAPATSLTLRTSRSAPPPVRRTGGGALRERVTSGKGSHASRVVAKGMPSCVDDCSLRNGGACWGAPYGGRVSYDTPAPAGDTHSLAVCRRLWAPAGAQETHTHVSDIQSVCVHLRHVRCGVAPLRGATAGRHTSVSGAASPPESP